MGFEAGYLNSAPEGAVRAKMLGNAVHIGVISHLLRPLIATLPTTRRWVVLSLFNGIDGFLLGLDQAAESVRHAMYVDAVAYESMMVGLAGAPDRAAVWRP